MERYGRWQIQVQVDGVRRTFYSSIPGTAGKRECYAKADAWIRTGITGDVKRVRTVSDEWLETLKPTRENQSSANYTQYNSIMKTHVLPAIGLKKVRDVSNGDIQRIIDKAAKAGLSKKTLQNIRGCCVAYFKYCRKNRYADLVVDDIDIPWDAPKSEKKILQPDAVKTVMSVNTRMCRGKLEEDYYINVYRWQLVTGMRPGEMIARTKADVHDGYVYIRNARNVMGEITHGKNDNAVRKIKLTPLAKKILKDQAESERRLGITSTLLFPDRNGGYIDETNLYKRWRKYLADNGIEPISLYEMRHTFVSMCTESVPETLLKLVVGHSESMDTSGVYGHEMQGQLDRAADAIESTLKAVIGTDL
jgi:integrase